MPNNLGFSTATSTKQTQTSTMTQETSAVLRQTPQPVLIMETKLLGMTLQELEQDIDRMSSGENLALEENIDSDPDDTNADTNPDSNYDATEYKPAEADGTPTNADDTDFMERYLSGSADEYRGPDVANGETLQEFLADQAYGCDLTDKEKAILEFLIHSLNNKGYLTDKVHKICNTLERIEDITASQAEVNRMISVLQTFEPYGIGARTLQEALIIQLKRGTQKPLTPLALAIVTDSFEDFCNKHFDRITKRHKINRDTLADVYRLVSHLNPYPGYIADSNNSADIMNTAPLFEVKEDEEGNPYPVLLGNIKRLKVSDSFRNSRGADEITAKIVSEANTYIQAVKKCRQTQMQIARIIVREQTEYFKSGDIADLKPLTQQDIARRIGRDSSVVSRALSGKDVKTYFGTIAIARLLQTKAVTSTGIEMFPEENRQKLLQLVAQEDKTHPLSDEQLADMLQVKRRTIANYRKKLEIPTASKRRQL